MMDKFSIIQHAINVQKQWSKSKNREEEAEYINMTKIYILFVVLFILAAMSIAWSMANFGC